MRLRTALFVGFLLVPLAEISLFIVVGGRIGLGWTLTIVALTAFVGSALVARQGRRTWARFQQELVMGIPPGATIADGAMILVAGALLLTPGFLTDATGFLLLVPAVRRALRAWFSSRARNRWVVVP